MQMETIAISRYLKSLLKTNIIYTVLVPFNHNMKYIIVRCKQRFLPPFENVTDQRTGTNII